MTNANRTHDNRWPAVGKCIYCLANENLSDEHVIALALGGRHILPKASCAECARLTGRDEALILRGGLWAVRDFLGFPSRSSERPNSFRLHAANGDEGQSVEVDSSDYPVLLSLPTYCGPLAVVLPDCSPEPGPPWHKFLRLDPNILLERYGLEEYAPSAIDAHAFARVLMKIAHGLAVAEFGLDGFEAFLPQFILGQRRDFLSVVGSTRECQPPTEYDHRCAIADFGCDSKRWIVAQLNLFERFAAPGYRVIVGQHFGFESPNLDVPQPPFDSPAYAERIRMVLRFSDEIPAGFSSVAQTGAMDSHLTPPA